jgi:hypothetical protein
VFVCVCVFINFFVRIQKKKGTLVCYKDIGRGGVRVGYIDYYTLYIRIYIYIYDIKISLAYLICLYVYMCI